MKLSVKNGKRILVPRSIKHISVGGWDFSYEDWSDICIGLKRKIKAMQGPAWRVSEDAIRISLRDLSYERTIRATYLTLRALVPSRSTFHLVYAQIYDLLPTQGETSIWSTQIVHQLDIGLRTLTQ